MTEQYDFAKYRQEICFHYHCVKSEPSTLYTEISPKPEASKRDCPQPISHQILWHCSQPQKQMQPNQIGLFSIFCPKESVKGTGSHSDFCLGCTLMICSSPPSGCLYTPFFHLLCLSFLESWMSNKTLLRKAPSTLICLFSKQQRAPVSEAQISMVIVSRLHVRAQLIFIPVS